MNQEHKAQVSRQDASVLPTGTPMGRTCTCQGSGCIWVVLGRRPAHGGAHRANRKGCQPALEAAARLPQRAGDSLGGWRPRLFWEGHRIHKKEIWLDSHRFRAGHLVGDNSVRSGQRKLRVRIEPDDATMQEDGISGDFAHNSERELSVSAQQSRLSLPWLGTSIAPLKRPPALDGSCVTAARSFSPLAGPSSLPLPDMRSRNCLHDSAPHPKPGPKAELGPPSAAASDCGHFSR